MALGDTGAKRLRGGGEVSPRLEAAQVGEIERQIDFREERRLPCGIGRLLALLRVQKRENRHIIARRRNMVVLVSSNRRTSNAEMTFGLRLKGKYPVPQIADKIRKGA